MTEDEGRDRDATRSLNGTLSHGYPWEIAARNGEAVTRCGVADRVLRPDSHEHGHMQPQSIALRKIDPCGFPQPTTSMTISKQPEHSPILCNAEHNI